MADATGIRAHEAAMRHSLAATGRSVRDQRLDVFRGLALVMIYINHVPGTVYEYLTSRNFGFSDAAEGFVLMSGIAAGLAYSAPPPSDRPWQQARRAWSRSFTLYQVHLVVTVMAIGISAAAALWFGATRMIEINNMAAFFDHALGAMIGIPLLTHQLGYVNILPLYCVLVAATPALILAGRRSPLGLFLGAVALWAAAGELRLNFPNYPNSGGWFFNPFSWQLIFVIGLLTGLAMRRRARLVGIHRPLLWLAIGYLVCVLAWRLIPVVGAAGRDVVTAVREAGMPFYVASFDKTFLSLPRLLHALAIFYVISALPVFRAWASSASARPLALLGRHGLPVFATGTVLAILGQSLRAATAESFILDAWIIGGGLALQLALAYALARLAAPAPATA